MAGRFFGFGKKRPGNKQKQTQPQSLEDSDDDDAYIDSETSCPTEPPRVLIPNYPPPRRPGSPAKNKENKQQQQNPRIDYQDPWDSTNPKNGMSTASPYADPYDSKTKAKSDTYSDPYDTKVKVRNAAYCDPFDSKKSNQSKVKNRSLDKCEQHQDDKQYQKSNQQANQRQTYQDPFDAMVTPLEKLKTENTHNDKSEDEESYDMPYEGNDIRTKGSTNDIRTKDNYDDPWDTKTSNNIVNNNTSQPKIYHTESLAIETAAKKDDYKDPWDSKISSSLRSMDSDDTYSEPYDKDKTTVLDEKKSLRKSNVEEEEDEDDMYDLPYEERVVIGIEKPGNPSREVLPLTNDTGKSNGGKILAVQSSIQKTSNNPAVPQDDYDSPWEWNVNKNKPSTEKEPISKRSSLGNNQQIQESQLPPNQTGTRKASNPNAINKGNINPIEKPPRKSDSRQPEEFSSKYVVDPTILLQNQGWFHGPIRRWEAENLLCNQPDSSFLIRNSESSKLDYSLSLRNRKETMHLKISCRKTDGKYILGVNSRPYDTIPEMIHYYSTNKLNIRGAEHIRLEYPVFSESMYFIVEPGS